MKKLLLSILCISGANLIAQPVLQQANVATIGFTSNISVASIVAPGPAGAAQTWNFSSTTATPVGSLSIISPASAPCIGSFTAANMVESISGAQYNYYARSTTKLETISENLPASCTGGNTYSNYKQILKFPFNYLDTYTDTYFDTGAGTVTVTCDAYGTITTPYGIYSNVIRVKTVDGSTTSYQWITTGINSYPVMIINSSNTIFFYNGSTGINENSFNQNLMKVYPNPAKSNITIETSEFSDNSDIAIHNLIGQTLYNGKTTGLKTNIDISAMAQGMYIVEVKDQNKTCIKKLIIE